MKHPFFSICSITVFAIPLPSLRRDVSQGEKTVRVTVRGSRGSQEYEKSFTFCLVTREFGTKKGCLMTSAPEM